MGTVCVCCSLACFCESAQRLDAPHAGSKGWKAGRSSPPVSHLKKSCWIWRTSHKSFPNMNSCHCCLLVQNVWATLSESCQIRGSHVAPGTHRQGPQVSVWAHFGQIFGLSLDFPHLLVGQHKLNHKVCVQQEDQRQRSAGSWFLKRPQEVRILPGLLLNPYTQEYTLRIWLDGVLPLQRWKWFSFCYVALKINTSVVLGSHGSFTSAHFREEKWGNHAGSG